MHQNQIGEPFATGCQLGGNGQKRRRTYKSWRKGQAPLAINYFAFGEEKALCVVETLNEYINGSKPWRESN